MVAPQPPASAGASRKSATKIGARQDRTNHLALDAYAAAVDDAQAHGTQSVRLVKLFLHHGLHIARRNAVQVENVRDGNADRLHKNQRPGQPKPTGPNRIAATART